MGTIYRNGEMYGSNTSIDDTKTSGESTWSSEKIDDTKADNSVIAPVESGATASKAYAIGEHFIRDNAFCTAIAAITKGASFTLNTNYEAEDIASVISSLNSDLRLKQESISYTLSDYTKIDNYYKFPVPNTHNYILAELVDWGNGKAAPFTSAYNKNTGIVYLITGTPAPTSVTFYLWYYE